MRVCCWQVLHIPINKQLRDEGQRPVGVDTLIEISRHCRDPPGHIGAETPPSLVLVSPFSNLLKYEIICQDTLWTRVIRTEVRTKGVSRRLAA